MSPPRLERYHVADRRRCVARSLDHAAVEFHSALEGYERTPLIEAPVIAKALGLGRLLVKDEAVRWGLPSYKALGAFWAAHRAVCEALGHPDPSTVAPAELGPAARERLVGLTAPTDGNHGRAVARFAASVGLPARVFLPAGTAAARLEAIEAEPGASAEVVDGTYLAAVRAAVRLAEESGWTLVTDFAADDTGPTPAWVIDGYSTIFTELGDQLAATRADPPDVIAVQVGAGALACAAARWIAGLRSSTTLLTVEPATAAGLLSSLREGGIVEVPGPHRSTMAGLNCDSPSALAFAELGGCVDAAVAIRDEAAAWAMQALAATGIEAGESGAAGLGGIAATLLDPHAGQVRDAAALRPMASVLVLVTERITDPESASRSMALSLPEWPAVKPATR